MSDSHCDNCGREYRIGAFDLIVDKDHKTIEVDNNYWNFTPFQIEYMLKVQTREDFDHFFTIDLTQTDLEPARKEGKWNLLWNTKDGKLHAALIGTDKVIVAEIVGNDIHDVDV